MEQPKVSVIMPVYNASRYLRHAIESILHQTFGQIEFVIINDGSTDDSEKIILSYKDERIVYLKNEINKGLIFSLNLAIEKSRGIYIARMDADDIAKPERIEKQFTWLTKNPETSVVATQICFINEDGIEVGEWKDDMETVTSKQIKAMMKWKNCIAHPSVMLRSEVARKYLYQHKQVGCEDHDMWLRILADGLTIEKLPEKLLLYRTHDASITGGTLRKKNPFFIQYNCKKKFLAHQISKYKWGLWEWQVMYTCIIDGITGIGKNIKKRMKF